MARRFLGGLRGIDTRAAVDLRTLNDGGYEEKSLIFTGVGGVGRNGWTSALGTENRAAGWDLNKVIRDGYERNVWVFKAVEAISGHQARLPFRIGRNLDDDDREEMENHPLYRVMNRRANPAETARVFRKRLSAQVLLSKKGAFVEVTKSRAGTITRLDLLPPDRVEIIPDQNGDYIDYFQFIDYGGEVRELAPERVRWIREPHPTDPFSGTTPLEAAGMSVQLDDLSRQYNVSFIQNDARPGGIIGVDADQLSESMLDRIQRLLGKGAHRAGEIAVVGTGPGGLNYVDTTTRPRDMAYSEASANSKLEILIAFGVPESVIGSASGKTFDNAEQEGFNFWSETMAPHLDMIASAFDEDVDDEWEPFLDTTSVQVLELPRRQARAEALGEFNVGLRSVDEYRPLADLKPVGNAQTRALWLSPQKAPVPTNPGDAAALGVASADGGAGAAPGATPGHGATAADAVSELRDQIAAQAGGPAHGAVLEAQGMAGTDPVGGAHGALAEARAHSVGSEPGEAAAALDQARMEGKTHPAFAATSWATNAAAGVLERKAAPDDSNDEAGDDEQDGTPTTTGVPPLVYDGGDNRQQQTELAIAAAMSAILARQLGVITARLDSPKTRKGTKFWTPTDEDDTRGGAGHVDTEKVTDPDRWADEVSQTIQPLAQAAATSAAGDLLQRLADGGVLVSAPTDESGKWATEGAAAAAGVVFGAVVHAETAMRAWLADVATRLDGILATASDMTTATSELKAFYGDRADSFARGIATELATGLVNGAEESAAASLTPMPGSEDTDIVRSWMSRRDTLVRPAHRALDDGVKVPVGTPFTADGYPLRWPGDPLAPASLVRNCRCRLTYAVDPNARLIGAPATA